MTFVLGEAQIKSIADKCGTPPLIACKLKQSIESIKKEYKVDDDEMVEWPKFIGITVPFKNVTITKKEAELLDTIFSWTDFTKIEKFRSLKDLAFDAADEAYSPKLEKPDDVPEDRFNEWRRNDGHNDAFRHAYWNALMTKHFGLEFAEKFATAHEGVPNNPQHRETMDLYNNYIGRSIAAAHPNASDEELANFIKSAVTDGDLLLFNSKNDLAWSDDVEYGKHGLVQIESGESNSE